MIHFKSEVLNVVVFAFALAFAPAVEAQWRYSAACTQDGPRVSIPGYCDPQGFTKEVSQELLDADVKRFLDAILRIYKEPGLFLDRTQSLQVLEVTVRGRRWSASSLPYPPKRRAYAEEFSSNGLFSNPAWNGVYRFNGENPYANGVWSSAIDISINRELYCLNSRAVEGYLGLVLDPNLVAPHTGNRAPNERERHEAVHSEPVAPALMANTPNLYLGINSGCVTRIILSGHFKLTEFNDEQAYN